MSYTATQVREKALKKLGVIATGQTTQAQISTDLDEAYVEVYAMLNALGLTTWDDDEDIPNEMVTPVVYLVAGIRKDEYSIPNDRYQRIKIDQDGAIMMIKEFQASNVYKIPEATYY